MSVFGANLTPSLCPNPNCKYAKIVHYATTRYYTHMHSLVDRFAVWDVAPFPVVAGEAKDARATHQKARLTGGSFEVVTSSTRLRCGEKHVNKYGCICTPIYSSTMRGLVISC